MVNETLPNIRMVNVLLSVVLLERFIHVDWRPSHLITCSFDVLMPYHLLSSHLFSLSLPHPFGECMEFSCALAKFLFPTNR